MVSAYSNKNSDKPRNRKRVVWGKPAALSLGMLALAWMAEPKFKRRARRKVLKKSYADTRQALSR
jgi:hypothetical protein